MFSFFRRSKKDPDSNSNGSSGKDNKRNNKELVSPVLEQTNMCKNNISPKPDSAPESSITTPLRNDSLEFGLQKNVTNASTVSEVTPLNEKNETKSTNFSNSHAVLENPSAQSVQHPPQMSYASMLKKPEPREEVPPRRGSNVKPCGHGTTAISPRIPVIGTKRENTSTPPSSPVLEPKKLFKKPPTPTGENCVNEPEKPTRSDELEKNTVTASMKLHVNLPTPPTSPVDNSKPPSKELDSNSIKKNLINQEAKFQSQLNDLSKQLSIRDAEANKLRFQMEELQRDVFTKSAGMDRVQAELNAALKESEIVKQRIKHLELDLELKKKNNTELSDEICSRNEIFSNYTNETKARIAELEEIIKTLRERITELENELSALKREKKSLEQRHAELLTEREEEKRKVAATLEQATIQKQEIEKKWKQDFEKLRTINILKEQQLLDDFEWKLREVQQSCKKRLDEKDRAIDGRIQEAYKQAEEKMKEAENMMSQIETLKHCEVEVEQLRDLTLDQDKALKEMIAQQEQMKLAEDNLRNETKRLRTLIEMEKENLQHMQRVHHQEILDKERTLRQTLNQKRTEIAMYWEERLMRECGRLKSELEQIHDEEKFFAMESVRKQKDEQFEKSRKEWELKIRDCLREIASLKKSLTQKDIYYHEEMVRTQTNTDRDIIELRRLMDKIDMTHHDRYEKLVQVHEEEIERINAENEKKLNEVEANWKNQVTSLRATVETVKEQMEKEAQQKIENLIQQHRTELDSQWENLIHQKSEAIKLVEEEYVTKYKTLEEQYYKTQKSHSSREIELLKTIDSLKNELESKESTIDDLQNNVDTLEGGVQVLHAEIAKKGDNLSKSKKESDMRIKNLEGMLLKLQEQQEKEREAFRLKLMGNQKQSQETIDHLQRKCQCLTKLFEEVRLRYERRESKQEDLNIISDLRQVIAEQEKDLACINEEKRYFQMRLMNLEKQLDAAVSAEEDEFEDAQPQNEPIIEEPDDDDDVYHSKGYPGTSVVKYPGQMMNNSIFIPPTIPECDDCDE